MKKTKHLLAALVIAPLALFVLWNTSSSSSPTDTTTQTNDQITVSTTISPLQDIAAHIAGENIAVNVVLPPGASPHTFEITPSVLREMQGVDVIYSIGYGLDDWASDLAASQGTDVVIVDKNVALKSEAEEEEDGHEEEDDHEEEHDDDHEEEGDHEEEEDEHGHEHGETDPHYWLSISNAEQIAKNISADLSERYPEMRTEFEANLTEYLEALSQTHTEIENLFADLENKNMVNFHDAWFYFANEFDLTIVGTFEPSAGREPTPRYLAELTHALETAQTSTIFSEPQFGTANLEAFAADNQLNIVELDPIGGVEGRESYIDLMLFNARTIVENN